MRISSNLRLTVAASVSAWTILVSGLGAQANIASITGVAQTANRTPIAEVTVRLRDARFGRIAAVTRSTKTGQFVFSNVERGMYVTEMLNEAGGVIAASSVVSVEAGEAIATAVTLSGRVGSAAAAAAAAAGNVADSAAQAGTTAATEAANAAASAAGVAAETTAVSLASVTATATPVFVGSAAAAVSAAAGAGVLTVQQPTPTSPER